MQLRVIFHKAVKKKKLKVWKFQSHRLNYFSAIKETVNWSASGEEVSFKFVLLLSL